MTVVGQAAAGFPLELGVRMACLLLIGWIFDVREPRHYKYAVRDATNTPKFFSRLAKTVPARIIQRCSCRIHIKERSRMFETIYHEDVFMPST